jgi:hypothetical protein
MRPATVFLCGRGSDRTPLQVLPFQYAACAIKCSEHACNRGYPEKMAIAIVIKDLHLFETLHFFIS